MGCIPTWMSLGCWVQSSLRIVHIEVPFLSWINIAPKDQALWPRFPNFRHLSVQVDEETALEQAVKFCQVHLGAATQRQVSSALYTHIRPTNSPAYASLSYRTCPTPKPWTAGPEANVLWSWFLWSPWAQGEEQEASRLLDNGSQPQHGSALTGLRCTCGS